ncbi:universal stress protein [Amycolatopsis circi]|uniref:universal stress protein n=1 Tax=Amycolatopsis circi TaxID=871959 RepID=UPI000E279885|nr:universal stress protein [Amycolatopsis circi]
MTGRDRTVLVGIGGWDGAAEAVRWAARLAAGRDLELELVHCLQTAVPAASGGFAGPGPLFEDAPAAFPAAEDDLAVPARVRNEVYTDSAPALLIDRSRDARMVVLGRTGTDGFTGMLAGAATAAVVSNAGCPVAVVRGRHGDGPVPLEGPVAVGVDTGPNSEAAIAAAFEEASFRRVPLVAVHAWADVVCDAMERTARPVPVWETRRQPVEERLLAQRLDGWQEKYPDVRVHRKLVRDWPRQALLDESGRAQLMVVGSRGRGGFAGMQLGSTSQALIHHASCPVLVVRPEARR